MLPLWVPVRILQLFYIVKLEWQSYQMVKKFEDRLRFSRCDATGLYTNVTD